MLIPAHRNELHASGLTDETIGRAGLYSATPAGVTDLLGHGASGGLVFPYPSLNGGPPFARVKLDIAGSDGTRYRSPLNSINRLYLPNVLDRATLADASISLYVTEGEKKTLALNQGGLPTIGLAGVYSWLTKTANGTSVPIPDLDQIVWADRTVYLVFDSDVVNKRQVRSAEATFARELGGRGAASVSGYRLPPGPHGEKVGIDDYLRTHSVEAFCDLDPVPLYPPPPLGLGAGAFLRRTYPPPRPLIEGLLSDEGGGWRGGEEKLGKSIEVLDEALCLTLALPVLGRFIVAAPRRVLLVSEEDSPRRTYRRLRALLRGHDLDPDDPDVQATLDERLRIAAWEGFRFDDAAMIARLEATIAEVRPEVIYLDVLRKMTAKDLNKADQASLILDQLDGWRREFGCVFLVVHHYRKAQGFRASRGSQEIGGSFVLGAWGENSLFFEPLGRSATAGVKLDVQVKDGPPTPPFRMVIESAGPPHDPLWLKVRAKDLVETRVGAQNRAKILDALRTLDRVSADLGLVDEPGVPVAAIVKAVGLSDKSVRTHLRGLQEEKLARLVGYQRLPRPDGKPGATKVPLWLPTAEPAEPETPR